MRLIDANELKAVFEEKSSVAVCGAELCKAIISRIDDAPTVEAVPADYIREKIRDLDNSIKNYVGRFDHSAAVDAWFHQRGALEGLIAEWEETED